MRLLADRPDWGAVLVPGPPPTPADPVLRVVAVNVPAADLFLDPAVAVAAPA